MKKSLISLLTICSLNLLGNPALADASEGKTRVLKIVIRNTFDVTGELQAEPVRRLSQALAKQPSYSKFRLIWAEMSPTYPSNATAVYNRQKGTLAFYCITFISGLGNEDVPNQIRHWKYTGVKPWMIHKIAKRHKSATTGSEDSFLSELSLYGCKRANLQRPDYPRAKGGKPRKTNSRR